MLLVALITCVALLPATPLGAQDDATDPSPPVVDPDTEPPADDPAPDPDDPTDPEEPEEPDEPPPPPQVSIQSLGTGPIAATDDELRDALFSVDYLSSWYAATPTAPELTLVEVEGDTTERTALLDAVAELTEVRESIADLLKASLDAATEKRGLEDDVDALEAHREGLLVDRAEVVVRRDDLEAALEIINTAIESAAVGLYVNDQSGALDFDDVAAFNSRLEMQITVDASLDDLLGQRHVLEGLVADATAEIAGLDEAIALTDSSIADLHDQIDDLVGRLADIAADITDQATTRVLLELAMPERIEQAHQERLSAQVAGLDISLVTLDTYLRAVELVPEIHPTCAIRWEMLAGIAQIESDHARFGGAWVEPDGTIVGEILGPVLDGSLENTAIIDDSDNGSLDGNAVFDRAVGPFQFLPSTWYRYGLDGNDDEVRDPHNMYDAALSAAGYLCASSSMDRDTDIERSVLTYNNSRHYLAATTGVARSFIQRYGVPTAEYDPDDVEIEEGWRLRIDALRPTGSAGADVRTGPRSRR